MRRYGLIGYPLGHSFSQAFFREKFAAEGLSGAYAYENYPIASVEELPALIAGTPDLCGLNVTIPYKQAVLPYLDELDPQAARIGAVNCIRIDRAEDRVRLTGYNTDAWGFSRSLVEMIGGRHPDALVLGTGGASKAVAFALGELGIRYRFVSRRGSGEVLSYAGVSPALLAGTPLIVNTTPLGTFPDTETLPDLPYEAVGRGHFLHDLVYNPPQTAFLLQGRQRGATVRNGAAMLVGQAERSWEIWQAQP